MTTSFISLLFRLFSWHIILGCFYNLLLLKLSYCPNSLEFSLTIITRLYNNLYFVLLLFVIPCMGWKRISLIEVAFKLVIYLTLFILKQHVSIRCFINYESCFCMIILIRLFLEQMRFHWQYQHWLDIQHYQIDLFRNFRLGEYVKMVKFESRI